LSKSGIANAAIALAIPPTIAFTYIDKPASTGAYKNGAKTQAMPGKDNTEAPAPRILQVENALHSTAIENPYTPAYH
jgi:hypothetical protein